jgi:hypothetical protein
VAVVSAVAAVVAAILVYRSSSRATDVNAHAENLKWVVELRQEAKDTKTELRSCYEQVRELSRQLTVVTREADHWIAQYELVHRTAWRPGMTLERIRELLGPDLPPQNTGRSRP